jgi:hypothetical protein
MFVRKAEKIAYRFWAFAPRASVGGVYANISELFPMVVRKTEKIAYRFWAHSHICRAFAPRASVGGVYAHVFDLLPIAVRKAEKMAYINSGRILIYM